MVAPGNAPVLMIGWEYPPHNSGGLGVACEGMTKALAARQRQVYFTLPHHVQASVTHMNVLSCAHPEWFAGVDDNTGGSVTAAQVFSPPFSPYAPSEIPEQVGAAVPIRPHFGAHLTRDVLSQLPQSHMEAQVHQYAEIVAAKAQQILPKAGGIHAHDWMSFPAALKLKRASGKPMIAHIHSTEVDRIPFGRGSDYILQTEYDGMLQADVVVAVSHYTKRLLHQYYDVPEEKIVVIHNGIDPLAQYPDIGRHHFAHKRPVIAFMGRLTAQKGAEYFLSLGRSVLNRLPHALFIVAGSGDMYHQLILTSAAEQLTASVLFSGFVRDKQRDQLLNRADVFVMPSLSEPFGLVALEAAQRHTPVILSKTVGASEVLPHSVTADFWDVNKMSEHVCALISDTGYRESVIQGQLNDLEHITWDRAAQKIDNLYADIF